jgi:two-component system, LytTR family, response regulator
MKINIGSRTKVQPSEVLFFTSDSNYTIVHLINGEKVLVSTHLKKIEKRFASIAYFFRPNRSYLINLNFAEFQAESSELNMNNQQLIPVSRRKKPLLLNLISKTNF